MTDWSDPCFCLLFCFSSSLVLNCIVLIRSLLLLSFSIFFFFWSELYCFNQFLAFVVFFAFLLLLIRIVLFWLIWLFEWLISCFPLLSFSICYSHLFRIALFWLIKETASAPPDFVFLIFIGLLLVRIALIWLIQFGWNLKTYWHWWWMIVSLLQQVDMKIKHLKIFEMHFVALAISTILVKLQKLTGVKSIHQTKFGKQNFHFLRLKNTSQIWECFWVLDLNQSWECFGECNWEAGQVLSKVGLWLKNTSPIWECLNQSSKNVIERLGELTMKLRFLFPLPSLH